MSLIKLRLVQMRGTRQQFFGQEMQMLSDRAEIYIVGSLLDGESDSSVYSAQLRQNFE